MTCSRCRCKSTPSISDFIFVPETEDEYNRLVALLDELIHEVGQDERHPLASLMQVIGTLIEKYESEHVPELSASATGKDLLEFLMQGHKLTAADLPEIGSAKEVSEVLSGKRELSLAEIRALSKRFGVSPATFLQPD